MAPRASASAPTRNCTSSSAWTTRAWSNCAVGWTPTAIRARYKMPKLLLLGTNDPFWVVDSLRNYWNDLPEPKLIFQTPNAGHDLAGNREAAPVLAAFVQMIADREPLPRMTWEFRPDGSNCRCRGGVPEPARQRLSPVDGRFPDPRFPQSQVVQRGIAFQSRHQRRGRSARRPRKASAPTWSRRRWPLPRAGATSSRLRRASRRRFTALRLCRVRRSRR